MARVRRSVSLEDHVPEVVAYISSVVGRDLPQPVAETQESEQLDDASDEDDAGASREPRVRGRAPIFEPGQRAIASLMDDIERGVIALPDLQRPFVWEDTKSAIYSTRSSWAFRSGHSSFGTRPMTKKPVLSRAKRPALRATTLVIDGQQRLTSLYAVMRGVDSRWQRRCSSKNHDRVSAARRAIRGCRRGDP